MGIRNAKTVLDEDGFLSDPATDDMYNPEDWSAVVPKSEIQASSFLEQHPEFDGRGVTIAILDTGVDPGASGLQITTQGDKKIIDVVDCTGSGDVDTSTVRELDEDGCVEGIHGNKMKVHPDWKNPSKKWHVGSKRLYELYPEGLRHRMKAERKMTLQEHHNALLNKASVELYEFNEKNPSTSDDVVKKKKEELEARVEVLAELIEKYEDFGPSVDCVVWHDGDKWLAAIDTSQMHILSSIASLPNDFPGRLADFVPLTNYRDCLQYGTFSALDACNFALNIYDEGNTLSIVVDAGSHGTHVAGISAGHYPEDPCLNGIAPGAKIVSCKIGDTRLGSMETMTGLTRAYQAIIQNKCDLINMSYGEAASAANSGRFVRLADELVHKHHVIFVASAGNAGPALSTVGAPGGTSNSIMGIGAFVSPDLAKSGHSVRHAIESGAQYTWSSRGPTADGDLGVSISAPGGAITTVPQWTTQKKQLMNGTSMSSPCACGGLALVVSAMKASGMVVTPSLVRRAAENSAMPIKPLDDTNKLTYGNGLLQVASCWEYLRRCQGTLLMDKLPDLHFVTKVKRSDGHYSGRGVYLRDPADSRMNRTFNVMVKPELHEDADVRDQKLNIDLKLKLSCTADWIVAPSMLMLHHNGRQFEIEVNCEQLDYGLHYAEVQAFESSDTVTGPLFRIPVCVLKPQLITEGPGSIERIGDNPRSEMKGTTVSWKDKLYIPGMEDREYIMVPHGATWAEMVIRPIDIQPSMACMVRATSLEPHTRYSDTEYRSFVRLTHGMEHHASFPVIPGSSLEITIAQFWSSFGKNKVSTDLTFHGVHIKAGKNHSFALDESSCPVKAILHAPFRSESIKPVCKLDSISQFTRPKKAEYSILSDPRNTLPGNRIIHNLVLSYHVSITEAGSITPKIPSINNYVYDGELSGQIMIVSDKNKRLIGVGDIYAESMKVKKGDYSIVVCLRHENLSFLKTFEDQVLQIERKLETSVSLPIYENYSDALHSKASVKKMSLAPGEKTCIFIGKPSSNMPKDAGPGKVLHGTLRCAGTMSDKQAPGGSKITYICPPQKEKSNENSESCTNETLEEKMRAAKVSVLQKASDEDYMSLKTSLLEEYPGHLPILHEELKRAGKDFGNGNDEDTDQKEARILSACDDIINLIDRSELAIFLAKKNLPKGPEAEKMKQEMKAKKDALIGALSLKTKVLLKQDESNDLERTFELLREWVDTSSENEYLLIHARKELRDGNYGLSMKHLNKIIDSEETHGDLKEALELKKSIIGTELKWQCWEALEEERIRCYFPSSKLTL